MLDGWGDHPAVVETLREASEALGEDVGALIKNGPKEELALTTNTQPVLLRGAHGCPKAAQRPPWWRAIRWANTRHWSLPAC